MCCGEEIRSEVVVGGLASWGGGRARIGEDVRELRWRWFAAAGLLLLVVVGGGDAGGGEDVGELRASHGGGRGRVEWWRR